MHAVYCWAAGRQLLLALLMDNAGTGGLGWRNGLQLRVAGQRGLCSRWRARPADTEANLKQQRISKHSMACTLMQLVKLT